MIDLSKMGVLEKDMIQDLYDLIENLNEVELTYNGPKSRTFLLDPYDGEIHVFLESGSEIGVYKDMDDFFLNFKIDDVSVYELIASIDYSI